MLQLNHLGQKIRSLREGKGLLLRELAASIGLDTAFLSKMERGERYAKRNQVIKLATRLDVSSSKLLSLWLADKIGELIIDEKEGKNALEIVRRELLKK